MSRWLSGAAVEAHLAKMRVAAETAGRVTTVNNMLPEGEALGTKQKPKGRPKGKRSAPMFEPEAVVLRRILDYLKGEELAGRVRWSVRLNSGAVAVDGKRYIRFGFPGCPDVMFQLSGGRIGFVEVKSAAGRLSRDQGEFLGIVVSPHTLSGVARNLDDLRAILDGRSNDAGTKG